MKERGEEFLDCLGNGKTKHELDSELEEIDNDSTLDLDWEETNIQNRNQKGGLNENGKSN